ncbi:hypothetical protein [Kitasatospora sp. NPDC001547]|uniref:hypothetical protein n=1 Tax=Kitasatospora sp. NPDC001547 TaxID=3364015 RepID=UPI0036AE7603
MTAALHTVRLVPVGGSAGPGSPGRDGSSACGGSSHRGGSVACGGSAAALFEARVMSTTGIHRGLLAADPAWPTSSASPASPVPGGRSGPGFVDEHLVLDLTGPGGLRWRRHADVLHLGPIPAAGAHVRLADLLSAHPGCAVATAEHRPGALLVLARTGAWLVLRARGPAGGPLPPSALGSLAHAWLAAGRALGELDRISAARWYGPGAGWHAQRSGWRAPGCGKHAPGSGWRRLTPPGRPDAG